jgi:hypothetical protein
MAYFMVVSGGLCLIGFGVLLAVLLALGTISQSADAYIQEGKS